MDIQELVYKILSPQQKQWLKDSVVVKEEFLQLRRSIEETGLKRVSIEAYCKVKAEELGCTPRRIRGMLEKQGVIKVKKRYGKSSEDTQDCSAVGEIPAGNSSATDGDSEMHAV